MAHDDAEGSSKQRSIDGSAAPISEQRTKCAVLVPTSRHIEPECEDGLRELERRGYFVQRARGCTSIEHARSVLATAALDHGFDETFWIDSDIAFEADAVERLRAYGLPIVAGVYPFRHPRGGLAVAPLSNSLVMGESGGLVEVSYAATGFMLVRREVYETIQKRFSLPLCDAGTPRRSIPFFMSMLEEYGGSISYMGEDYSFCRRARLCGYKIMADTSIRLWHLGMYPFGYEDAGNEIQRVPTYYHVFAAGQGAG